MTETMADDDLSRTLPDLVRRLETSDCLLRQRAELERADEAARTASGIDLHLQGRLRLLMAKLQARLCHQEQSFELLEQAGDTPRTLQAAHFCIQACIEAGDTVRALEISRSALAEARRTGESRMLVRLLNSQALAFICAEECEAAVLCAEEALQVRLIDKGKGDHDYAQALLAALRVHLADGLARRGQADEAEAMRQRARPHLPKPSAASPLPVVHMVLYAVVSLGDDEAAGPFAREFVRRVRGPGGSPFWRLQAFVTLGIHHLNAGRFDKAVPRFERAIRGMRATGRAHQLRKTIGQLAAAHAGAGRHCEALRWLREAQAHPASESSRLHGRMVALQRDVEWRRVERETVLLHTKRLAVVGRLMAQIYHSLEAPLVGVSETLATCLARTDSLGGDELAAHLQGMVACLDEASGLARQLKMFSYRAAPQSAALDFGAALHEAWRGMTSSRGMPVPPLVLSGRIPPQVRGDAQRLAVLLRILFSEIERMGGACAPRAALSTNGTAVRVEFACACRPDAAGMANGVGFTLCEEIAREMQGELWRTNGLAGEMLVSLELPADV
jgi:tetratricopeptide (TPR) repeat protein